MSEVPFVRGAVRPIVCIQEGWQLIKPQYSAFLGITLVGVLIAGTGILLGPMFCGIYYCLFRRMAGRESTLNHLFKGLDYFYNSFIAYLLMVAPALLILLPAWIAMMVMLTSSIPPRGGKFGNPPQIDPGSVFTTFAIFYIVMIVVSLLVHVFYFFIYPLVLDQKMTGTEAVKTSFKAAMANFGGILGLVFLLGLMTMAGALCCYIGAIFVMPINFAAVAIAYRQVFPEAFEDKIDWEPTPRGGTDIRSMPRRDQIQ